MGTSRGNLPRSVAAVLAAMAVVVATTLLGSSDAAAGYSPVVPRPGIVNAFLNNATAPKYRSDMAAYSLRHYGVYNATLRPRAVVLHYTVSGPGSVPGIINTWDQPNASGGNAGAENPQPAAHFIIEQDGTIYQTMPTDLMVRHAYGINDSAIGIEFVEMSSATNVLHRGAQVQAGLALVRWLMFTYGIPPGNILGHGTVNDSPLFHDLTGAVNDHTDWNGFEVGIFRWALGEVPIKDGGPGSGSVTQVATGLPNSDVLANVTVVDAKRTGFTTVYPCDTLPLASHNNFVPGQTVAGMGVFRTDANGRVCLYTSGQAHLLWDQSGTLPGVTSHPGRRLLDTRNADSPTGGRHITPDATIKVHTGTPDQTVVGTLTVADPVLAGFAVAWTCGSPRPVASVSNFAPGQIVPNVAVVRADANGDICLSANTAVHLLWDQTAESSSLAAESPVRLIDTREASSPTQGVPVQSGQTFHIQTGAPGRTVLGNLTAVQSGGAGYLTLYPCDVQRPPTSSLNVVPGLTVANFAAVRADANGEVCVFTTSALHLIWDQVGTVDGNATGTPVRLLDTRG